MKANLGMRTGEAVRPGTVLDLSDSPSAERVTFGQTLRLRFRAAVADRLEVDHAAVRVGGAFLVRDHVAAGTGAADDVRAVVTRSDGALIVRARAPARVLRVHIEPAAGQHAGDIVVQLHRMDGDRPAKESSEERPSGALFAEDFTDRRFALRATHRGIPMALSPDRLRSLEMRGFPTGARLGLGLPGGEPPTFFFSVPGEAERPSGAVSGSFDAPETSVAFADALQRWFEALPRPLTDEIDVMLVAESDAPCRVRIDHLTVAYDLVRDTFRAALLRPADLVRPASVVSRLREASEPFPALLSGALREEVREALARSTGRRPPDTLVRDLAADLNRIMQSRSLHDAAAIATLDLPAELVALVASAPHGIARTVLNRRLLDVAFAEQIAPLADPVEERKIVVRDGDATPMVEIDVPGTARIRTARVIVSASLRDDVVLPGTHPNAGSAGSHEDARSLQTPQSDGRGVSVDADTVAAVAISTPRPFRATGVSLAVLPTVAGTELVVEMRADTDGEPSGRVMAAGRVALGKLHRPAWVAVPFAAPVFVTATPMWLTARAVAGGAVWLTAVGVGTTIVGDDEGEGGTWRGRLRLEGRRALHAFRATTAPTAVPESEGGAAGPAEAGFRARLGARTIVPVPAGEDLYVIDLAAALTEWLAREPRVADELVKVPLEFRFGRRGLLTVYPPVVHFDA